MGAVSEVVATDPAALGGDDAIDEERVELASFSCLDIDFDNAKQQHV